MLSKNIVVGTEYAVVMYYDARSFNLGASRASRVTVIEAPAGSRVATQDANGTMRNTQTCFVLAPWAEYATARRAHLDALAARKVRVTSAAEAVRSFVPEGTPLPWWTECQVYPDGSQTTEGKLTITELAALLRAAYLQGANNTGPTTK